MARLFSSVRIAPGLRLSTSSRGLRAHVGPRTARMHVGGGGTGVSTGAGPVTLYQGLGSKKSSSAQQTDKAQLHRQAAEVLRQIEDLHRANFLSPRPIEVDQPRLPAFRKLTLTAEKDALKGVNRFDRDARAAAKAKAREQAEAWAIDLLVIARNETAAKQADIDLARARLAANEPQAVTEAVSLALEDHAVPAHILSVEGDEARLIVRGPDDTQLPTLKPSTTSAGSPTVAKMSKTDRALVHRQLVAAHALLVAKQVFAVAPGLRAVRVTVSHADSDPGEALLQAAVSRDRLAASEFGLDAWAILTSLDPAMEFKLAGRTKELKPFAIS